MLSPVLLGKTKSCGCLNHIPRTRRDLTGQVFGYLTVIGMSSKNGDGVARCQCICGKTTNIRSYSLLNGDTTSCRCKVGLTRRKDLTGQKFGMVTVLSMIRDKHDTYAWCRCDCGTEWPVCVQNLRRGATLSCRCRTRSTPEKKKQSQRAGKQRRRARERHHPASLTTETIQFMLTYWGNACAICQRPAGGEGYNIATDHWIPLSSPNCPGTVATNLLPLCHNKKGGAKYGISCNPSKQSSDPEAWLVKKLGENRAKAKLAEIQHYFTLLQEAYADDYQEDTRYSRNGTHGPYVAAGRL
jgi:hypothetical protein